MSHLGDQLLERICDGGNDAAANRLLNEFFRGYPIENLRRLLCSRDDGAVKAGSWIASELGERVAPLLDDLVELLQHPLRYVRFFVIDAILCGATSGCGEAIAKTVLLIRDSDDAVRWKALRFLSNATADQLRESLPYLSESDVSKLIRWLLSSVAGADTRGIIARIKDDDDLCRLIATAAAARMGPRDSVPLQHAAASPDPEVSSFAKEELDRLGQRTSAIRRTPGGGPWRIQRRMM